MPLDFFEGKAIEFQLETRRANFEKSSKIEDDKE